MFRADFLFCGEKRIGTFTFPIQTNSMKRIFFLLLVVLPFASFAQLQDDFNDGDFTNNPAWGGLVDSFIVNASQQLQLNASATGAATSYLSVANAMASLANTEWRFWIKQSFSPSSSNFGRVYLVSDQGVVTGPLNGYYLQFGESGSLDAVELFRQDGSASTSVCRGTNAEIAASFTIGIKVTRDASGLWTLSVDPAGGTNYATEATGNDATYNTSAFFGIQCSYTLSNATKFYFDDIFAGAGSVDVTPPTLVSATALSTTQLDLLFSEGVDAVTAGTMVNYVVDQGIGTPVSAARDGSNFSLVHLQFAGSFVTATTYTVTVNNVNDLAGNTIGANSSATFTYSPDATPPALSSAVAASATQLDVLFSEAVDIATSQTASNYSVDNLIGTPSSALRDGSNFSLVHLTFGNTFSGGTTYSLTVNNVKDLAGNTIAANSIATFTYTASSAPVPGDVVITEFMADPDPVIGLPNAEYIEIYNRSTKTFDLNGWKISDSGSPHDLTSFLLLPDSFLILCSTTSAASFAGFGNVMGVTSFPSLNNTGGDDVILFDPSSVTIDKVHYDESYYNDASKADGGWSIERIDPDFTCLSAANWRASVDPSGGTPGRVNSVDATFADNTPPRLLRACLDDSLHVTLYFSEAIPDTALSNILNYYIAEGDILLGNPVAATPAADGSSVTLTLSGSAANGVFTVSITSTFADCAGNGVAANEANFATPEPASRNDILFNEVLFSVDNGAVEFAELYNASSKIIDLGTLEINNYSITSGNPNTPQALADGCYLMFPSTYLVLSDDGDAIKAHYTTPAPDAFLDMSFPDLLTDEDMVVLKNSSAQVIDSLHYYSSWHFPLLNDVHNISLERLSATRETNDPQNWHSASETVGFATPGYKNSQQDEQGVGKSDVTIEPEVFSPDNDGVNDVVNILFHFTTPGYLANVKIYDSKGRFVRTLVDNKLLGNDGSFSWDGVNDDKEKSRTGIYVFYIEVFNINGDVKKYKKTCVLATKL